MDDNKVYTPEVIADEPFPQEDTLPITVVDGGNKTTETYSQSTIQDQPLPVPRIANEVFSASLNTKTRKILGKFNFTPSGAIQIGDYKEGENGDISISPIGILARNVYGNTTFSLDGETGDVYFLGTVRAGSIISESAIQGGSININNVFTVDNLGNMMATKATIIINDGTNDRILIGKQVGGF